MTDATFVISTLADKKVTTITIVDDALDPVTSRTLKQAALNQFWAEIEDSEALKAELTQLGIQAEDIASLTDPDLELLYDRRDSLEALKQHVQRLMEEVIKARSEVQAIKTNLEDLNLKVISIGPKTPVTGTESQIYLLDYYLGPVDGGDEAEQAVLTAIEKAKAIYAQYSTEVTRPIVLLMSSRELNKEQVQHFRKASKLLGGMFHHIPKAELSDKDRLARKLLAIAKSFPVAHAIEALIEGVELSLRSAQTSFVAGMRDLSLEDYIYIQQLSLKEDGQPFGDYLLWLFAADLHRRVFENEDLEQRQRDVDSLPILDLPPRQLRPSSELAEMYKSALFKKTLDVRPHPLSNQDESYPWLSLGDIFINDDRRLFMVLNPECDLAFSPASEGRAPSATKSITLIPGTLLEIQRTLPRELSKVVTELFTYQDRTYRISWDTKRVVTCQYIKMDQWLREGKYRREYRLRLLYALQIQHEYISDFGRVGSPVAPPIFNPLRLEIFTYDEQAKIKLVFSSDEQAALITTKGVTKGALDLGFLEELCSKIPELKTGVQGRIDVLERRLADSYKPSAGGSGAAVILDETQKKKAEERIERCKNHIQKFDDFNSNKAAQIELISLPFELPEVGASQPLATPVGLIHLYHEKQPIGNFQEHEPLILCLTRIK